MIWFRPLFLSLSLVLTVSAQAQRLNPGGGCLRPPTAWLEGVPERRPELPKAPADAPKIALPVIEAALVLKSKENSVKYERIFEKKANHVIEDKNFTVEISTLSALNLRNRSSYQLLEVTVKNPDGQRIAYQRQYAPSLEAMNNLVMEFLDPQSGDTFVVGVRSEAAAKRLQNLGK